MKGYAMDLTPAWENKTSGDLVSLDKERALVQMKMGPPCSSHQKDIFCPYCLPRLVEALEVVRRILDPTAPSKVSEHHQNPSGCEYIALHNAISDQAFTMRYHSSVKVLAEKELFTGGVKREALDTITLLDYTTKCSVCDAYYLSSFFVRLKEGGTEEYLQKLWETSLTIAVDGEILIRQMRLRDALGKREIILPKPLKGTCLFRALEVDKQGEDADRNKWLGYMLPNRSQITITLEKVPSGGGLVLIETGTVLGLYSTKSTEQSRFS